MELHEFHILGGDARRQGHADAAAGVDERVGRFRIGPAVAAGGKDAIARGEAFQPAAAEVVGDHAVALAVGDHQPRDRTLIVDGDAAAHRLLVERVQQHVPGAVGGVAGARKGGAAEGPLGNRAVGKAAEGNAPVLHFIDHFGGQGDIRGTAP